MSYADTWLKNRMLPGRKGIRRLFIAEKCWRDSDGFNKAGICGRPPLEPTGLCRFHLMEMQDW